ncbi:hypothetical protein EON65_15525 [archaeon]|nr:MAG: hypothetical protein EON65_15525 [archaeon]
MNNFAIRHMVANKTALQLYQSKSTTQGTAMDLVKELNLQSVPTHDGFTVDQLDGLWLKVKDGSRETKEAVMHVLEAVLSIQGHSSGINGNACSGEVDASTELKLAQAIKITQMLFEPHDEEVQTDMMYLHDLPWWCRIT